MILTERPERLRAPSVAVLVVAAICFSVPLPSGAQRLAPVTDAERCDGQRIDSVMIHRSQRILTDRLGALGTAINATARNVQPLTPARVVRRFLLLSEGDTCVEQRRTESERILRAQPYISDAVIRVVPAGPGTVRLDVQTIDEYVAYAEGWGLTGIPFGLELGSTSLFGGARSLSGLVEYGRGDEVGVGARFADYQALGRRLTFRAEFAQRPYGRLRAASLQRPFLTNFQKTSWQVGFRQTRGFHTFRDPEIRDVSLDYARLSWVVGGVRRLGSQASLAHLGAYLSGESTNPVRTVVIREAGPIPAPAPILLQRYHAFESVRAGAAAGLRAIRFVPVHGLNSLSGPQDVGMGWQVFAIGLRSIDILARDTPDFVGIFAAGGTTGTTASLLQLAATSETRWSRAGDGRTQTTASGRLAWHGKTSLGHTTALGIEFGGGWDTRVPMQITFRGDDGLLGHRSTEVGGARRIIARFEDRHSLPSPLARMELAVAALAEAGRLEAGDTPYGASTPWRYGAGIALLAAAPAGAKQTVRIELGFPLNTPGRKQPELRILYSDRTAFFWREPGSVWLAREAAAVGIP